LFLNYSGERRCRFIILDENLQKWHPRTIVATQTVIMPDSEERLSMTLTILRHCTITDLFLLIFGVIVFFVTYFATSWFLILIGVFILVKAYFRSQGVFSVCAVHGPPPGGDTLNKDRTRNDDDWDDDDDGVATGLYD
jgi:hypothetical protein